MTTLIMAGCAVVGCLLAVLGEHLWVRHQLTEVYLTVAVTLQKVERALSKQEENMLQLGEALTLLAKATGELRVYVGAPVPHCVEEGPN
jgi:hypothetical protein